MNTPKIKTLIIGAGLSGLQLAALLEAREQDYLLLEARERTGGRIFSEEGYDMGPAWFWPHQPRINSLVKQLNLGHYLQTTGDMALYQTQQGNRLIANPSNQTSFRLKGGLSSLTDSLQAQIPSDKWLLGAVVTELHIYKDCIDVVYTHQSETCTVKAERVVSTVPLRLLGRSMTTQPSLPQEVLKHMARVPTWMAGHAKAVIEYRTPFWLNEPHLGEAFSQTGPLMEIHDASQPCGSHYGLFGFIGLSAQQREALGQEKLKQSIVDQLCLLFGDQASEFTQFHLFDWSEEAFTATEDDKHPLNYHPRYGEDNIAYYDGKLVLAGTETAIDHGGYLEGALESAERAFTVLQP